MKDSPAPPPAGPPHAVSRCRVTYRMTDQMGVVYYAHYFELFEIGRTDLLRAAGVTYRQMEAEGYFLPVLHAEADYLAPARYDDALEIQTWLARLSRVRIAFTYAIRRISEDGPDSPLLCTGATEHAFLGKDGRPRRLSAEWLARIEGLDP